MSIRFIPTVPTETESQHVTQERLQAQRRVGKSHEKRADWILNFAACSIGRLGSKEFKDLQYEVAAFAISVHSPTSDVWDLLHWAQHDGPIPAHGHVESFQNQAKMWVGRILAKESIIVPFFGRGRFCLTYSEDGWKQALLSENAERALLYGLWLTLSECAHRIRRCPECAKAFLATRSNQRYCLPSCQIRVASRKYLGTPPERLGKRGRPSKKDMAALKLKTKKPTREKVKGKQSAGISMKTTASRSNKRSSRVEDNEQE